MKKHYQNTRRRSSNQLVGKSTHLCNRVDELLKNPPKIAIDRNFERLSPTGKVITPSNKPYKYAIHNETKIYHDASCPHITEEVSTKFTRTNTLPHKPRLCSICASKILIHKGLYKPGNRELDRAIKVFENLGAKPKSLRRLIDTNNARLWLTVNGVKIDVNEDSWIMKFDPITGKKTLLHNNYEIRNLQRYFLPGYHDQQISQKNFFTTAVRCMVEYSWDEHVDSMFGYTKQSKRQLQLQKARENKELNNALTLAPENPINCRLSNIFRTPGIFKIRKFKLLRERFLLLDTYDLTLINSLRLANIHVKFVSKYESSESNLALILCDIPRWHILTKRANILIAKRALVREAGSDYYYARRRLNYLLELNNVPCNHKL